MAAIKGVAGRAADAAIASVCAQLDLERVVGLPVGKLSRGYRQRVAIAQALLNNPPIFIFDEPTNALDAYQVIGIRELIRSLAGERTVLVASHVLTEIEKIASRIMILRDGGLLTADATSEGSRAPRFQLRIVGPSQPCWPVCATWQVWSRRKSKPASPTESADTADKPPIWSKSSPVRGSPRTSPSPSSEMASPRRTGRAKTRSRAHIPRSYPARHGGTRSA